MSTPSNRFAGIPTPPAPLVPTNIKGYIVCPVCKGTTYLNGSEVGYHGGNGGAHLCDGSGYPLVA